MPILGGTSEPILEANSISEELVTHKLEPSMPITIDLMDESSPELQKEKKS